ncbi:MULTISPECIES: DUF4864 domain-containing protein [unclassified Aureimonas]|uniref:DUF4864 domain-containing protein n=1 Tax=unclassified Aureimonas TaxID=2615206 RepID=UPI0006FE58F3|nr:MULTISPECIES: DUF4864 domain-containing protein [unclassified Aureimonas]KQT60263.1 topoisomerase II [Aureimonas sp. Leaf427]KQT79138.1 topoisomerase II [Aureimonas sp. Leaf460]
MRLPATAAFALSLLYALPVQADDSSDIKAVVAAQLEAFKRNDGVAAYSYAAPNIRQMFPSAQMFMTMVEGGYAPVFRSSNAVFGEMKEEGASFRQEVFLTDPNGQSHIASYTLERQPDGSLKITGCSIRKGNDISA